MILLIRIRVLELLTQEGDYLRPTNTCTITFTNTFFRVTSRRRVVCYTRTGQLFDSQAISGTSWGLLFRTVPVTKNSIHGWSQFLYLSQQSLEMRMRYRVKIIEKEVLGVQVFIVTRIDPHFERSLIVDSKVPIIPHLVAFGFKYTNLCTEPFQHKIAGKKSGWNPLRNGLCLDSLFHFNKKASKTLQCECRNMRGVQLHPKPQRTNIDNLHFLMYISAIVYFCEIEPVIEI